MKSYRYDLICVNGFTPLGIIENEKCMISILKSKNDSRNNREISFHIAIKTFMEEYLRIINERGK
ncbi:MAG: hypothetical protein J6T10_27170 [Methanobrevibacter sp.]|nr:hypothetical protein [Methanobrevibacter sp.]